MRLTTSPPSCSECHEIWEPKPPGTLWATPGLLRESFTFFIIHILNLELGDHNSSYLRLGFAQNGVAASFNLCSALINISGLVSKDFENGTLLRTIHLDSTQPLNFDLDKPQDVFAIISEQIHISSLQIVRKLPQRLLNAPSDRTFWKQRGLHYTSGTTHSGLYWKCGVCVQGQLSNSLRK